MEEIIEQLKSYTEAEMTQFLSLAQKSQLPLVHTGGAAYNACLKAHAGECGVCAQDGTFTACG